MENLKINKRCFVDDEPSENVWKVINLKTSADCFVPRNDGGVRKSLFVRFRYRYVAVPVFLVMIFGSYMVLTSSSSLDKEITQTQTAMQELIAMADTEVF